MKKYCSFFFVFFYFLGLQAQQPEKWSSSEIFQKIQELNFLGSVLYIAAHPDDENTRLISYLSNHLDARTAYLSLTRGDGGQNLIGPELRELLGVIRTEELLAAREVDGGEQFFTRANDFGYSKSPRETLEIWNGKAILKDVVRVIRRYRPDIVINRFSSLSAGETHGHHTASAILSQRAFELAAEPDAFPKMAGKLGTWTPKKLFFNTSSWFYESKKAFDSLDKSNLVVLETGQYDPLTGLSNTEVAALSRSKHRSQGFGSTGTRGGAQEYLEPLRGHSGTSDSLFSGINTTWSRIKGGRAIGKILEDVQKNYDFQNPSASLANLLQAYELIQDLEQEHWRKIKSQQIRQIIVACAGIFLEAVAERPVVSPGNEVKLQLEAINRSPAAVKLLSVELRPTRKLVQVRKDLSNNSRWNQVVSLKIPDSAEFARPYWLRKEGSLGLFNVSDPALIGLARAPREYKVVYSLELEGTPLDVTRNIVYKYNDPVTGEIYSPFEVVPVISVSSPEKVVVMADQQPKNIPVRIVAMEDVAAGTVSLEGTNSWNIQPGMRNFGPLQKGETATVLFTVSPPAGSDITMVKPMARLGEKKFGQEVVQLDYDHIPTQRLVLPAQVKLVKLQVKKKGEHIGYIPGAGDGTPEALRQLGYTVDILDPDKITPSSLSSYDAVVIGIRAYNVVDALRHKQDELFQYVFTGGTLMVQYNTTRGLVTPELAPFPLQVSRNRVTDEEAPVHFLAPDHPVLNEPNKITKEDFKGWVQERGLYFPDQWGRQFIPILSMKDQGEVPVEGSLLIAPYGKGHYIYSGLSFFRELPAGVPGAFRLLANLVSLGQSNKLNSSQK